MWTAHIYVVIALILWLLHTSQEPCFARWWWSLFIICLFLTAGHSSQNGVGLCKGKETTELSPVRLKGIFWPEGLMKLKLWVCILKSMEQPSLMVDHHFPSSGVIIPFFNKPMKAIPFFSFSPRFWWNQTSQAGYVHKLNQMLAEHDPAVWETKLWFSAGNCDSKGSTLLTWQIEARIHCGVTLTDLYINIGK